jgi:single-strand DNA-binding protein
MGATIVGIGRLGKDPVMQYTPSGTAQTRMNVAVDSGFGDKRKTTWFSLICWGQLAELLNEKLTKGARIAFNAEFTDVYVGENGSVNVNAKIFSVEFLSKVAGKAESDAGDVEEF